MSDRTIAQMGIGTKVPACTASSDDFVQDYSVGVELELESFSSTADVPTNIVAESDGSLRNGGIEFKFRKPLSGLKLQRAIDGLATYLQNSTYSTTERCSTHIHLDVTDMTPRQLINFMCLAVMVEPLFFRLFGERRACNNFCLATDMGTSNYNNLVHGLNNPESYLYENHSKYSAIGLYRLRDLGTVEFRMFHPIVEASQYKRVINLMFSLKSEAKAMDTPQEIIDFKLTHTVEELFSQYFNAGDFNGEYEALLERGIQTLNDIITTAETLRIVEERTSKYRTLIEEATIQLNETERGL